MTTPFCCPTIVGKLKCLRRAGARGRQALSRQLCVAATRAPMMMTTGWQWLRRHCWRRCTWVYSRDRGKQPMHTVQQIAHTPCMPSRGKRQRVLSLINEQVTTADKGESHTANPVSRRWKQKDLSKNLPADKALSDVTCRPHHNSVSCETFFLQIMRWFDCTSLTTQRIVCTKRGISFKLCRKLGKSTFNNKLAKSRASSCVRQLDSLKRVGNKYIRKINDWSRDDIAWTLG